jgi:hypothetical protein
MKHEIISFKHALEAYQNSINLIKNSVIEKITNISPTNENQTYLGGQVVVIPFSAIASSPTHSLEPFFYNIKAQKEKLIQIVENSSDLSFMGTFEEIVTTKKLKVYANGSYYYEHYNSEVIKCLYQIITEFSPVFRGGR